MDVCLLSHSGPAAGTVLTSGGVRKPDDDRQSHDAVESDESLDPFHATQTQVDTYSSPVLRARYMVGPPMGALSG